MAFTNLTQANSASPVMAKSKFLQYQDLDGNGLNDACPDLEITPDPFVCLDCTPDPKAAVPDWKTRRRTEPFLNNKNCKYQVTITTKRTTTGYAEGATDEDAETALQEIWAQYASTAAYNILLAAGKVVTDTAVEAILNTPIEYTKYYLDPRPNSHLKLLYSVPFEAVHAIERIVDVLAKKIGRDPADLRMQNFIQPHEFPYQSALGWEYDSGDYPRALKLAMKKIGYDELRREQVEKRARGELMGIGLSTFTEIVGAGPSKDFDILGIKMFDSCEVRIHPTGKAIARFGTKSQGQGHETTYAQILAEELGIPSTHIQIEEGDTDTAPYGLGTYASRSTPTAGAAAAKAAYKVRDKARKIAAHLLEVSEEDLEWEVGKFFVKGSPEQAKTIQDIAFAAYTDHPDGMEAGLEATHYYDPPNMTFPFGSYICVVDIDRKTGVINVRRFVAIDDCGNIINPMILEGQIHGGLTQGLAPAMYEELIYDEQGNILNGNFMDYRCALRADCWYNKVCRIHQS